MSKTKKTDPHMTCGYVWARSVWENLKLVMLSNEDEQHLNLRRVQCACSKALISAAQLFVGHVQYLWLLLVLNKSDMMAALLCF